MVHKLANIYKALRARHCAICIFMGFGAPNSRAAPGSAHSSYATGTAHLVSIEEIDEIKFKTDCIHFWVFLPTQI